MKRFLLVFGLVALLACGSADLSSSESGNSLSGPNDPNARNATDGGTTASGANGSGTHAGGADVPIAPGPILPEPSYWENGTTCGSTPDVQLFKYTKSTYIFRQPICANFEAPFNYLFFGKTRAMLLDTGTGAANIRAAVDAAIAAYVADNGIAEPYPLVIAHTHAHGDHALGDRQFRNRPNTTLVGTSASAVAAAFGFTAWPSGMVEFELGNRVFDVMPLPGHESAHVAVYDRQEQLLFTGDTLYPGRLYIQSWLQFQASINKLAHWVKTNRIPVRHILGNHIEMSTTPGQDYPFQASMHPNERPIQLPVEQLYELDAATQAMGTTPRRERHANFIIYP